MNHALPAAVIGVIPRAVVVVNAGRAEDIDDRAACAGDALNSAVRRGADVRGRVDNDGGSRA